MINNTYKFILLTLSLFSIYSCQNDDVFKEENSPSNQTEQKENLISAKRINLGEKLENPYSVANMKIALENIKTNSNSGENLIISTTHLYVKFKPKTEEELFIIKKDPTIILYDIPLDYEIKAIGDFYHDPEVPVDQPTYQYASIPVKKTLPTGVEYEILEELFIPDEDSDLQKLFKSSSVSNQDIDLLVYESLMLTDNLDEDEIEKTTDQERRPKWRPAGRIQYYDHVLARYIGVPGIQVRARRWFTTHTGFTNDAGNYSCNGRFRRDANYSIKWERDQYSIRSGSIGQARLNGPKRRGDWNTDLGNPNREGVDDAQQYYAITHIGAFNYYYGRRFGLTSPPRNGFLKKQLKIAARQKNDQSSHAKARNIYFGSNISLQEWGSPSDEVYGTIIHELAHAAHRMVDFNSYDNLVMDGYVIPCVIKLNCYNNLNATANNNRRLLETWASTVEILFAVNRYRDVFGQVNYEYEIIRDEVDSGNLQGRTIAADNHYTSAGWDMIDLFDQRATWIRVPRDRVEGYTINQLEDALFRARSWWQWRDNIRDGSNNRTEIFLEELFDNWPN